MSVICIVVTYNRKELLFKCLDSLMNQTLNIDKILVVDNASIDGTVDELKNKKSLLDKIKILELSENIGGAGGFHVGMNYALTLHYDWIWMMDDDGFPEKKCLEILYSYGVNKKLDAISPVQIDINNTNKLAFPLNLYGYQVNGSYEQLKNHEFIENEANLFNGLLIRKNKIDLIGLPRSELFIRGDEVEYTKRMLKKKLNFGTVVSARFFHPSDSAERIKVLFSLWTIRDAHSDFKNYYMFRNRAVAFIEDGNAWLLPLDFIRYTYYFIVLKKYNWKGLKLWCTATYDGIRGRLGRHPKY